MERGRARVRDGRLQMSAVFVSVKVVLIFIVPLQERTPRTWRTRHAGLAWSQDLPAVRCINNMNNAEAILPVELGRGSRPGAKASYTIQYLS